MSNEKPIAHAPFCAGTLADHVIYNSSTGKYYACLRCACMAERRISKTGCDTVLLAAQASHAWLNTMPTQQQLLKKPVRKSRKRLRSPTLS